MKKRRRITQCPNCQTQLNRQENFCPNCGQENHFHNNSLKELWNDFIGSLFNFDSKIWITLKTLFTKPGKIPKDFMLGAKSRYVSPIRLFLFSSFLFFMCLQLLDTLKPAKHKLPHGRHVYKISSEVYNELNHSDDLNLQVKYLIDSAKDNPELRKALSKHNHYIKYIQPKKIFFKDTIIYTAQLLIPEHLDTISINLSDGNIKLTILMAKEIVNNNQQIDSVTGLKNKPKIFTPFLRASNKFKLKRAINNSVNFIDEKLFVSKILDYLSYSLIFMLPFTGLIIYLLYYNKHKKLYDSFIFSAYSHSHLLFSVTLLFLIFAMIGFVIKNSNSFSVSHYPTIILFLYLVIYNIIGTKNFYQVNYFKSVMINVLFLFFYLLISFVLTIIILTLTLLY